MPIKKITEAELKARIDQLGLDNEEVIKKVVCAIIGHSNIQTGYFGYWYCGRCDAQVGDSLGGVYYNEKQVVVGHNCETCLRNYKSLTWEDKFMAPDPFVEDDLCDD